MEEIRKGIDEIDYQILQLFSQRYSFVKEIVKFKTDEESVIAETRQKEVIRQRREWAEKLDLNPDLFEEIYRIVLKFNINKELEILKNQALK